MSIFIYKVNFSSYHDKTMSIFAKMSLGTPCYLNRILLLLIMNIKQFEFH